MDDQEKHKKNHKKSPSPVHKKKETKVDIEKKTGVEKNNEAGPSRLDDLPGSISTPRTLRSGLSKSEHNIPRIITRQDVANALKLSSTSFLKPDPHISNLNLKDLKIPIPLEKRDEKVDPATMMDLRKFMASCFKFTKETPNTTLPDVPMRVLSSFVPVLPNAASTSCAQTDECHVVGLKTNEVIVTSPPVSNLANIIETKAAKDAKNKSDTISNKSELGLANRDSMTSIGSNVCRICMTRGRERLISPCNCKGSLANVHLSCLERWLNQVGRNHCELCGFSYPAIRTPRYTVLQALRLWFGNPRNRSHLQSDCLIFWLLSTVTAGLLAVCIVGTQYFVIEGSKFGISHRITQTAMDFFMVIVLCGYTVTVYLLWKDHFVLWNKWRRSNVNVRLLLTPDAEPVPFVPRLRASHQRDSHGVFHGSGPMWLLCYRILTVEGPLCHVESLETSKRERPPSACTRCSTRAFRT